MTTGALLAGAKGRSGNFTESDESAGTADLAVARGSAASLEVPDDHKPSCRDEMPNVTAKAMLASPHMRKRWFMGMGTKRRS
jgi:hypothetical protein